MDIDMLRRAATARLDPGRRSELGQFFTPSGIAEFMAGMFTATDRPVSIMDAGAGVGSLVHAASKAFPLSSVDAWEIDPVLLPDLENVVRGLGARATVHHADFVLSAPELVASGISFDRAILNPPYRKIGVSSPHRIAVEPLGATTVNLYSAFVVASMRLLKDGGEMVAIVPRSCLNGRYHLPFRRFMLASASLDSIHVFESRRSAFSDDSVLQENVVLKFTKAKTQGAVSVSSSRDGSFEDVAIREMPFEDVVRQQDPDLFIRTSGAPYRGDRGVSLEKLRIRVSTGPVVEFRVKDFQSTTGFGVPLVGPRHVSAEGFSHPVEKARVNFLVEHSSLIKDLWPRGDYVVVKRITSKESPRRILAFHIREEDLPGQVVAFENHLNVYHVDKSGIDRDVASRLCAYLNSEAADEEFRGFSGSTQVNVTDLRSMTYPPEIAGE